MSHPQPLDGGYLVSTAFCVVKHVLTWVKQVAKMTPPPKHVRAERRIWFLLDVCPVPNPQNLVTATGLPINSSFYGLQVSWSVLCLPKAGFIRQNDEQTFWTLMAIVPRPLKLPPGGTWTPPLLWEDPWSNLPSNSTSDKHSSLPSNFKDSFLYNLPSIWFEILSVHIHW